MKFNLLSLVLFVTSSCVVFAAARLFGNQTGSLPAYIGIVVLVFGVSFVVAKFSSRDRPGTASVQIVEWLVLLTIIVVLLCFVASGWSPSYRS